ncbi:MAG: hypothetical protein MUF71_22125 [Candidatus Kapabacteria bacterium]|jgi:hypothetical protein|nr:hypothetical protein [Candidatus Kapabacteria bacterium]
MTEPTLEEIWSVRREIYAECDNDPYKLVAYYIAQQNEIELKEEVELEEA